MKRYLHNKSHYKLMSCKMGELVPVSGFEVIPGDTVQISTSALIRVTPLVTPVMHPCVTRFHTYYVPNRILDPEDGSFEWEKFITGGEDGLYATPPPQASGVAVSEGQVADYFGIKPGASRTYNSFLMRGYAKIWNEYYRDQQLQAEIDVDTYTGASELLKVAWGRDYFMSARPEPQLGAEVTLSLGSQAPVHTAAGGSGNPGIYSDAEAAYRLQDASTPQVSVSGLTTDAETNRMYADLSAAGAININDLRRAFALQRYQEARNNYGARFVEYLRYLGIRSSDARLQRPEYVGGSKGTISFSEILSTDSGGTDPVGTLNGHGIAAIGSKRSRYFCEENGHIITLMSTRPKNIYGDTQHRIFNTTTKEEYWQKELQQIGMQPIEHRELNVDHTDPEGILGYTDRYGHLKTVPSTVAAEMRTTLNSWNLARFFAGDTALNPSLIECDPSDRIYADTGDNDKLWCMVNNKVAVRSMLRKGIANRIL